MLLEGYIAKWNKYPKEEVKVRVARPSVLSPSKELLSDYKKGLIDWEEYGARFRYEIFGSLDALALLRKIKKTSEEKNVRLICYEKNPPCHRFILIDIINSLRVNEK